MTPAAEVQFVPPLFGSHRSLLAALPGIELVWAAIPVRHPATLCGLALGALVGGNTLAVAESTQDGTLAAASHRRWGFTVGLRRVGGVIGSQ